MSASASDAVESLFPRVDISGQLAKVAAQCNDSNWKIRKEGLDKVVAIIEGANKRIKPTLGMYFILRYPYALVLNFVCDI